MKMKLTAVAVTVFLGAIFYFLPPLGLRLSLVFATIVAYTLGGIFVSIHRGRNPFNDVPNAVRVLLAALAAFSAGVTPTLLGFSAAIPMFLAALLFNDEYQRRAVASLRKGRVGGSVALLGIDGSGKSTHSAELKRWFEGRGYYCSRVPFHRYLFVERLASARPGGRTPTGPKRRGHPLRPILSVVDNLIFYVISSFGRGLEGRVVLYDRFIWSTYVKYHALGYPVTPMRWLYMLPRPKFGIILDVPVTRSLEVIHARPDHIKYAKEVLDAERREYLRIAQESQFPVVDATREYAEVQREIELMLSGRFPPAGAG